MPYSLIRRNCQTSLHIHVELLLSPTLLQLFHFFFLVLKTGLPVCLLLLLALEVKLQIELGGICLDICFGLLEVVLQQAPHAIELQGLVCIQLVFEAFLLLPLPFFFDLLVQPLFLLVLEKFFASIILCIT